MSFGQTIEDLKNSKNPYNSLGEKMFISFNELVDKVDSKIITVEEFQKELENNSFGDKVELSDTELLLFKDYFVSDINVKGLIDFENYIISDLKLENKDNLLKVISYVKWGAYIPVANNSTEKPNFDACLDNCMNHAMCQIFHHGNWVDQVAFIAGIPGSVATQAASCAWDCIKK
jgi:hypothetical protein